jgi:predicted acetyltransferase
VTCDADNRASAIAIERCGGVLRDTRVDAGGTRTRRYWIA